MNTVKIPFFVLCSTFVIAFIAGCGGSPSEADCKKFTEKIVEFSIEDAKKQGGDSDEVAAKIAEDVRAKLEPDMKKLQKECVETATKAEIECALKATSMAELEKCG